MLSKYVFALLAIQFFFAITIPFFLSFSIHCCEIFSQLKIFRKYPAHLIIKSCFWRFVRECIPVYISLCIFVCNQHDFNTDYCRMSKYSILMHYAIPVRYSYIPMSCRDTTRTFFL